jgi:hypothetical protein
MKDVLTIVSGIGVLIGIYLFLRNGDQTIKIIDTLGKNATAGIATLQGNRM